jgi:hypothetical protein
MRRTMNFCMALILLTLACALPGQTPSAATDQPSVPVTQTAAIPSAPTATAAPQANLSCNNVSLYLDPALASGSHCETVPEAAGSDLPAFGINPQTTRITLDGYLLADRFHTPHLDVFSVSRYQEILPDAVNPRLTQLQALIAGGETGSGALPILPVFNAAQMFKAQYALVPFQGGSGIRFLAQYAQAYYPLNNHDMVLMYQGLTADGKYWVSLILPISHAGLAETGAMNPGPEMETLVANAENYFAQKMTELNAMAPDSFSPGIPMIDRLINSIQVQP